LKLRPVLRLIGEGLEKFNMPRSLLKAKMIMSDAIKADLNGRFKEALDKGEMRLAVVHAENESEAEIYKAELEKLFPNVPVTYCDPMSLSIACHVGPGTLAVACMRVNY
jgi:fatty acid-binding protein DegV